MLDWKKEKSSKNNCGYCFGHIGICDGMCFNPLVDNHLKLDHKKNREEHINSQLILAKKRLCDLIFERQDWASVHDVIYDITNVSLSQEGLEEIFDQLPDTIQFDAFKWGLSDTEVRGQIHKFIIDNEISFR